jgi:hypothetical protein
MEAELATHRKWVEEDQQRINESVMGESHVVVFLVCHKPDCVFFVVCSMCHKPDCVFFVVFVVCVTSQTVFSVAALIRRRDACRNQVRYVIKAK